MELQLRFSNSKRWYSESAETQYASNFGKLSNGHRTGKGQFLFQSQRKAMPKCSNYCTIAPISHTSKIMIKILQGRLQQYVNQELPNVQDGFRKGRGTRVQTASIHWIMGKARDLQKNIYFCFIDMPKPLTLWITINCGKFWKNGHTRPPDLPLEKSVCRSGSNS